MPEGRLTVCATPIGNLGDISDRLRGALADADVIYAEDTRRTGKLLAHIGAKAPLRSLFAGNEKSRTAELVDAVAQGKKVALVSDAGMPSVSDPGADAVAKTLAAGAPVTVIPGPSAVTSALAVSGFGGGRFVFEGFLPRREMERQARLASLGDEERVIVLFAAPKRLTEDIADLAESLGPSRKLAVVKELTKIHESVWVGSLEEAVDRWKGDQKGEFTLVVGPEERAGASIEEAVSLARRLVESGHSRSDAARRAARETGVSRRDVYQALIDG